MLIKSSVSELMNLFNQVKKIETHAVSDLKCSNYS